MAVKYFCAKCEKRYIDWGAEKLGFKCPECEGEELKLVGHEVTATAKKKPSLKRKRKAKEKVKVVKEAPPKSFEEEDDTMPAAGAVLAADGGGATSLDADDNLETPPGGRVEVEDSDASSADEAAQNTSS